MGVDDVPVSWDWDKRFQSSIARLQQPQRFLDLIVSHKGRLKLLRRKALTFGIDPQRLIIRCALPAWREGK